MRKYKKYYCGYDIIKIKNCKILSNVKISDNIYNLNHSNLFFYYHNFPLKFVPDLISRYSGFHNNKIRDILKGIEDEFT